MSLVNKEEIAKAIRNGKGVPFNNLCLLEYLLFYPIDTDF